MFLRTLHNPLRSLRLNHFQPQSSQRITQGVQRIFCIIEVPYSKYCLGGENIRHSCVGRNLEKQG